MIDVISILFDIFSLMTGIKRKKDLREKLADLEMLMTRSTELYRILSDAKQVHDVLEGFTLAALDPLKKSVFKRQRKLTRQAHEEHAAAFFTNQKYALKAPRLAQLEVNAKLTSNSVKTIPVEIQKMAERLTTNYTMMSGYLRSLDDALKHMRMLTKEGNFGDSYEGCLIEIDNATKSASMHADQSLLSAAHLVDYLFSCSREAVNELKD